MPYRLMSIFIALCLLLSGCAGTPSVTPTPVTQNIVTPSAVATPQPISIPAPAATAIPPATPAYQEAMNEALHFYDYDRTAPFNATIHIVTETALSIRSEVAFPSLVKTGYQNDDTVYGTYYQPKAPGKHPAIVIVHGWGATSREEYGYFAQMLVAQGYVAFIIALPFHMERTPPGKSSGEYVFLGKMDEVPLGFKQAVVDIRRVADWLSQRPEVDPDKLGIAGYSLGGILTNLVMGVDPRVRVGVAMVGGGDLARIIWESAITQDIRADIQRQGVTLADLQKDWAVIDPLTFASRNRPRNVLFINGKNDDIVPPAATTELWNALDKPEIIWLDAGHALPLPLVLPRAVDFFKKYFG